VLALIEVEDASLVERHAQGSPVTKEGNNLQREERVARNQIAMVVLVVEELARTMHLGEGVDIRVVESTITKLEEVEGPSWMV